MSAPVNEGSRTHVIAVGLERFQQADLGSVEYAADSVRAFAEAWHGLGVDPEDSVLLLDDEATKTTVESRLRRLPKTVGKGDTVVFLYAGRGIECDGRTLLLLSDSQPDDLEFSALGIRELLNSLERCRAGKMILFLDLSEGMELEEADKLIFVSASPGEVSRASGMLKRRLWLHAISRALTGKVKGFDGEIRADALQAHLVDEVSRLLRSTWDGKEQQTPLALGNLDDVVIAELQPDECKGLEPMLRDSRLLGERGDRVRTLSGFQKQRGHREPDRHSQAAVKFIQKIGANELEQHAARIHQRLKEAFNYGRSDVELATSEEAISIRTPDFDIDVWLEQATEECTSYRMLTEIGTFRNSETILSDAFDQAFEGICDTLLFELSRPFPVAEKIDEIESNPELAKGLDYDGNDAFTLRLSRPPLRLEVSADRILIRLAGVGGLVQLMRYAWEALQTLEGSTSLLTAGADNES